MIRLNDHLQFGRLDYVSNLLYYLHEDRNFQLGRPIVLFDRREELEKKKNWLYRHCRWLASIWKGLVGGHVEDNCSKTKFLGRVEVYP